MSRAKKLLSYIEEAFPKQYFPLGPHPSGEKHGPVIDVKRGMSPTGYLHPGQYKEHEPDYKKLGLSQYDSPDVQRAAISKAKGMKPIDRESAAHYLHAMGGNVYPKENAHKIRGRLT